ncbi:MAG: hypothetical protein GX571_05815 [Lentisphaerae bacterium]|nr:hypothetical protein [Lentisphaerota bacterium]
MALGVQTAIAEVEFLDYIDTTGSQWVDTGIVPYHDYSSAAAEGVAACPQLSGTGILRVRDYGGPNESGFLLFVR